MVEYTLDPVKLSRSEPYASNKKRKTVVSSTVFPLEKFSFGLCTFRDVYKTPKGIRTAAARYKDSDTKVLVQLNGGGKIPSTYGVSVNDQGKTVLVLQIVSKEDQTALYQLHEDIIKCAYQNRKKWFTEKTTEKELREKFQPFLTESKEKKDTPGEFWPPSLKCYIPLEDGYKNLAHIVETDGITPVHVDELPGRQWKKVIIHVAGLYFQKNGFGAGPKNLFKLMVEPSTAKEEDPSYTDFV